MDAAAVMAVYFFSDVSGALCLCVIYNANILLVRKATFQFGTVKAG